MGVAMFEQKPTKRSLSAFSRTSRADTRPEFGHSATMRARHQPTAADRTAHAASFEAMQENSNQDRRPATRDSRAAAWEFGALPIFPPGGPHGLAAPGGVLQTKLEIGAVDDPLEREANAAADRVMRMPDPALTISAAPLRISRKCAACEEEEKVRMKPAGAARSVGAAPPIVHEVLREPGRPLDVKMREFFEPRFGMDFGDVRIHDDKAAAESARSVGALAYTVGRNIVFGNGALTADADAGRRLLAHELAHTVQQGGAPAQLQPQRPVADELAHVVQQQSGLVLQRQGANLGSAKDQREFVRDSIRFLEQSVEFFQLAKVDDATFDRVINSWYSVVVRQEKIIETDLHGDATLKAELHTAYVSALRVLVKQHAVASGKSEADLYRINSGRTPFWAQPHPSHLEPGVTTPIPDDLPVTHPRGRFQFSRNGFDIGISPDTRVRAQRTPGVTHHHIAWGGIHAQFRGKRGHLMVVSVTGPPTPVLTIFTSYRRGVDTASVSAYGRGTTDEDKAGAKVTPQSGSLAFHESRHGQATLDFIDSNSPPAFTGKVGDTERDFNNAMAKWQREITEYSNRMEKADTSQVDCVGFTIDQFHAASARPRRRIVKECP
jgi:hypothetical protein